MSETHETMNELWAGYDVNNVKTASEIIKQQREAAAAAHLELIRVWHLTWGEEGFDKPDPLILHPLTQWRSPLYTIHDSALCYHIFVTVCIFCSLPLPINWSFLQSFQKNAPRYIRFFNTLLFFQCPMAWTYKWQKRIYVDFLGCDQNNVDITVLQGASVTLVTYLIPAQAWSIIPTLSRDCQMSNTFRATYYRQMLAGHCVTQYWNQEEGIM